MNNVDNIIKTLNFTAIGIIAGIIIGLLTNSVIQCTLTCAAIGLSTQALFNNKDLICTDAYVTDDFIDAEYTEVRDNKK